MLRSVRKPLIVMTPKWLLRLPEARSASIDFERGSFQETIDDPEAIKRPEPTELVLLSTGKIYYQLKERRDETNAPAALVRIEQLYPFPHDQLAEIVARYPQAKAVRWVQEEPENMGAWPFIHARLHDALPGELELEVVARVESASPATGSATIHEQEQQQLLNQALRPAE
jgi:2-oxoglutarate dehydrogenase complex dehydrogenase (E1) component-like enzyme